MQLAIRVHRLAKPLFGSFETRHVALQLFRASSSVAANYRAACLGRSRAEFVSKIATVREEADETIFWLAFMREAGIGLAGTAPETAALKAESEQLARIFAASHRTARRKLREKRRSRPAVADQRTAETAESAESAETAESAESAATT